LPTRVHYDALYQFPSFFQSLHHAVGPRTDLRPRLHVELTKMLTGNGVLDRRLIVEGLRPLFLTGVSDELAIIDSPVLTDRERLGALLFAAHPNEALDWARDYHGTPQREIARADEGILPINEAPDQRPPRSLLYQGVVAKGKARQFGVPEAVIDALLESEFPGDAASLGISKPVLDQVNSWYLAQRTTAPQAIPVPGIGSRTPVRLTLETLVAQLRIPLSHYLLQLTKEQATLARQPIGRGPYVIKGAAGTGKTLVGLLRMRHVVEQMDLFEQRPLLYTCYNQVLSNAATQLLKSVMAGHPHAGLVQVRTIHSLMQEWLRRVDPHWRFRSDDRALARILADVRQRMGAAPLPSWSDNELLEELFEVIYARGLPNRAAYLAADRSAQGRDRTLSTEQRQAVWSLYHGFRMASHQLGLTPWAQVAAHLDQVLEREPLTEPTYSGVIIDEFQDFTPAMISVVTRLQAGSQENLMLLGDPTQTVNQRGFRWKDFGIHYNSRNVATLSRVFRSSRAIIGAALPLGRDQHQALGDDLLLPNVPEDQRPPVEVWLCRNEELELAAIAERIDALLQAGMPPSNVAVLIEGQIRQHRLEELLRARSIRIERHVKANGRKSLDIFDPSVKVLAPSSAKGLEFQVVFAPGITEGRYPTHPSAGTDLARRRRELYVSMTRAGYSLVLSSRSPGESGLLRELDQQFVRVRRV